MSSPKLVTVPLKRRPWGCLVWPALALAALMAALAYCAQGVPCDVTSRNEVPSPDGKHVAIQLGTLCSAGFGNNSNGEGVLIDTRPAGASPEKQVFLTFDTPPGVRWLDNDTVEITVNAVSAINVSLKVAKGVTVAYRMRDGLTEAAIRTELENEQRRMIDYFKSSNTAERLNANARQRFENFIQWA